jgi:hypothetical protein
MTKGAEVLERPVGVLHYIDDKNKNIDKRFLAKENAKNRIQNKYDPNFVLLCVDFNTDCAVRLRSVSEFGCAMFGLSVLPRWFTVSRWARVQAELVSGIIDNTRST